MTVGINCSIVHLLVLHELFTECSEICTSLHASRIFFQALNFLVESFGLLNDLFPLPSILDAGYPVFYFNLADVLFDVILPSVLGSSL